MQSNSMYTAASVTAHAYLCVPVVNDSNVSEMISISDDDDIETFGNELKRWTMC